MSARIRVVTEQSALGGSWLARVKVGETTVGLVEGATRKAAKAEGKKLAEEPGLVDDGDGVSL